MHILFLKKHFCLFSFWLKPFDPYPAEGAVYAVYLVLIQIYK